MFKPESLAMNAASLGLERSLQKWRSTRKCGASSNADCLELRASPLDLVGVEVGLYTVTLSTSVYLRPGLCGKVSAVPPNTLRSKIIEALDEFNRQSIINTVVTS